MSNRELREKIQENQQDYINKLMVIFKQDPDAGDFVLNYKGLPLYLEELIEKDGSFLHGLISALEIYLEK